MAARGCGSSRSADEYADALAAAKREAGSAFGDDTMLVEKYVESGRHIEVQVLGDTHGNVVHLFERDCSTQRRHQKVLEEAPAPDHLRRSPRPASRARPSTSPAQVGYTNAGTVEFLLDNATGDFYFLEMNTRLQVEHPVTESVVRIAGGELDLVEEQLRVRPASPCRSRQEDVRSAGTRSRPGCTPRTRSAGSCPRPGRRQPGAVGVDRVRVDQALESNQVVSTSYDPMLGKVVAYGRRPRGRAPGPGRRASTTRRSSG